MQEDRENMEMEDESVFKVPQKRKNEVRDRGINSPEKMQGWRKENQIVMCAYEILYLILGLKKNSYQFCILLKTSRSF